MSISKFSTIEMSNELRKSIEEIGYETATTIQSEAIPLIMAGEDVIGLSQTGSGKTAAFGIPAIDSIDLDIDPRITQVLIVCPTRELALQSADQLKKFAKYKRRVNIVTIYGGDSINRQITTMRSGCQIVVGTPGRIMDHMRRHTLRLENVKMVVLDEADEMLNMGFLEDIENILKSVPETRQTLLFSATMSNSIMKITEKFLKSPKVINVEKSQKTVSTIEQYYTVSPQGRKFDVLVSFLEHYKPNISIVFCNTKKMVTDLVDKLKSFNYSAKGLHGDMKQRERTRVMSEIKDHKIQILVATDVAARGIDIYDVEIVFNYDIPNEDEYFIHRTGRTGRAGKTGKAISLVQNKNDLFELKRLAKFANCEIAELQVPNLNELKENASEDLMKEISVFINGSDGFKYTKELDSLMEKGYTAKELAAAMFEILMRQKSPFVDAPAETPKKKQKPVTGTKKEKFDDKDMVPVRISIGKKEKISVGHILSAVAGATGLPGSVFGAITIDNKVTVIDVPAKYRDLVIEKVNITKIKGHKVVAS